ncbi:MAG: hypothetical protein IKW98_09725 [Prevotella sp.]|nr:hypothetical protein [Prevotella sp.]
MNSKKDLKRAINYVCSDLFAECVAASLYGGKTDEKNAEALLTSILRINSDYVRRISHPEPGMPQKKYFKTLIHDFNEQVSEIIDQINNMG